MTFLNPTPHERKMMKLLPMRTEQGIIVGFIPSDYETKDKNLWPYSECCQDPRNWRCMDRAVELDASDPYYRLGYRYYRNVYCKCGVCVNATEYSGKP